MKTMAAERGKDVNLGMHINSFASVEGPFQVCNA
jgi:hypothetical protein